MADESSAKESEGDKKIVHTYPLVKVCRSLHFSVDIYMACLINERNVV